MAALNAVAGIVPHGRADLAPELNAVQTLVLVRSDAGWRLALYQNTPAQYHGRPELAQAPTEELIALLSP